MGSEPGPPEERASAKPILLAWLLLAPTTLPNLSVALYPPRGRGFAGTFHWIDDFHNYVSFVQQAEAPRQEALAAARTNEREPAPTPVR